ncbi:MAG: DUF177 domain-containing protein [Actinobacteria bacterium]|nr:DUF177 domain-containing protein [Actinomycetota bacterium]
MTSPLSGLVVNVAEVLRRVGNVKEIDVSVDSDLLELGDDRVATQDVPIAFHLESTNTGILVCGTVSAAYSDTCRRCLADVRDTVTVAIGELYQREITDPDAYPIEGEQLLLAPLVREHLLLALPDAPLCRTDCPGLCPVCGADKANPAEADCGCAVGASDPRWAALDALRADLDDR